MKDFKYYFDLLQFSKYEVVTTYIVTTLFSLRTLYSYTVTISRSFQITWHLISFNITSSFFNLSSLMSLLICKYELLIGN